MPETDLAGATELAERLRADFATHGTLSKHGQHSIHTTASFGVATAFFGGDSRHHKVDDLISTADNLMYEAKRSGRNCVKALQLR